LALEGTLDCFGAVKLPSRGEVLKVLFDFHRKKGLDLKTSINEAVSLFPPVWSQTQMPTRHHNHVITQVKKNYTKNGKT